MIRLTLLLWFMVGAPALGQELLRIEDLMRAPDIQQVALSPDGRKIAAVRQVGGETAAVLLDDMGQTKRVLFRSPGRPVDNLHWSTDGRWALYLQDNFGDEGYHLFGIDTESPDAKPLDLTPFPGVTAERIAGGAAAGQVVVALNRRVPEFSDVFAVDLKSGKAVETFRNDAGFTEFFADHRGQVVAATAVRQDGGIEVAAIGRAGSPHKVVYRAPAHERFKALRLSADGASLLARSNAWDPVERLISISLTTGVVTPLGAHLCGRFDLDTVYLDASGVPALQSCVQERAGLAASMPGARKIVSALSAELGPRASLAVESASEDLREVVVYSDESDRPGRFVLYRAGRGVTALGETRPWIKPTRIVSEARWLSARDGMPLLTYMTRSPRSAGPQPTIIAIHGGPWTRDTGGFEAETQLFADRGYTVLQVNFRGSTGLGKAIFDGGVREFGAKMSDDIDDAARWAVAAGISDPKRICLFGGSYGGYATLIGLARNTFPYRCGVSFAGPFDLATLIKAFPPSWTPFLPRSWHRFVGNPDDPAQRPDIDSRSPLRLVASIKAPMLVFQGVNDPRVTQAQSDALVCSLRARRIPATYLLAAQAGHRFGNSLTGQAVMRAAEQFLAQELGGAAQRDVSPEIGAHMAALQRAGNAVVCPPAK